jgi:hypothetical protein
MTASHSNQEGIVRKAMKWAAKFSLALAAVLALGLSGNMAHAVTIDLATLIANNGSITEGDKIFSNFTLVITRPDLDLNTAGVQNASGPLNGTGISVTSFTTDPLHHGLTFNGGFFAGLAGLAGDIDVNIGYRVSTVGGAALIHDIALDFDAAILTPVASGSVVETVRTLGGTVVGLINVNNPPPHFNDTMILAGGPYSAVNVTKDIHLIALAGGHVELSTINQTISQVPEPTSVLLLGSGLAAFGVWGMKRRKSA